LAASDLEPPALVAAATRVPIAVSGPLLRGLSFVLLLLLWEVAARSAGVRALPTVEAVGAAFLDELSRGELQYHLAITLYRVFAAFIIAMALGTALGLAMARWRSVDLFFDGWVVLLLNLPALVIAVLAYVWFGLTEVAAIGAVAVNKLPLVAMTLREGARSLSRDLAEMAQAFRLGRWRRLRHVVAPQLMPYFLVAARSGLSLIWKIVLVVELLGRSDGVGFKLQLFFQLFDVSRILAYAIAFAAIVQLIEWAILQPLERRAGAWRR
jgi:NitT/TauT family transport system permease protein